jgi:hypothetical protein
VPTLVRCALPLSQLGGGGCAVLALTAITSKRAKTYHHPVGTCRIGEGDTAVVDTELRVRGLGRAGRRIGPSRTNGQRRLDHWVVQPSSA